MLLFIYGVDKMRFDILIRQVRKELGLSQEQLAHELKVSFSTVNRWENQKFSPSPMARDKIANYCKKNNIDMSLKG